VLSGTDERIDGVGKRSGSDGREAGGQFTQIVSADEDACGRQSEHAGNQCGERNCATGGTSDDHGQGKFLLEFHTVQPFEREGWEAAAIVQTGALRHYKTCSHYRYKGNRMDEHMSIGALSTATGCNIETIRYYEKIGLLSKPLRSTGGHRLYTPIHRNRLLFILNGRELGFTLDQVRELIDLSDSPDRSCADAREVAERHLALVNAKLTQLRLIKGALTQMASECLSCCPTSKAPDCTIIAALARPRPVASD